MKLAILFLSSSMLLGAPASGPGGSVPPSYFGMVMHPSYTRNGAELRGQSWPSVPFGAIRLWDTRTQWLYLSPSRGSYDWSLLDGYLNIAKQHNVDVLYTFGGTPEWASTSTSSDCGYKPGACYPPRNIQDWDDFVAALATHAKGRIHAYELWNEANLPRFWSGGMSPLIQMGEHASRIIKSIDPEAMVLTPSFSSKAVNLEKRVDDMAGSLDQFFTAGGGSYVDGVAIHGYVDLEPEGINRLVARIREVMASHGQSGKPLWDTEASWTANARLPDEEDQVAFLVRAYVLRWARGVERFYWYAWNDARSGTLSDPQSFRLHRAGAAYGEVYKWLVGATMTSACWTGNDSISRCELARPGGYVAQIVWDVSGSKDYLPPAQFVQYRELDGRTVRVAKGSSVPVGKKPILLENSSAR